MKREPLKQLAAVALGLAIVVGPVLLGALLVPMLVEPSFADSGIRRTPCGYQQITSLSAASSLTVPAACGGMATLAVVTPEAQAVRYRDDGTDPSATVGMPLAVGVTLFYEGAIANIRFIEQTSGAKLNASFYR